MYNFEVPILALPDSCEQTTTITYLERTHKSVKIETRTQADKFPFANTFEIYQTWVVSYKTSIRNKIQNFDYS